MKMHRMGRIMWKEKKRHEEEDIGKKKRVKMWKEEEYAKNKEWKGKGWKS